MNIAWEGFQPLTFCALYLFTQFPPLSPFPSINTRENIVQDPIPGGLLQCGQKQQAYRISLRCPRGLIGLIRLNPPWRHLACISEGVFQKMENAQLSTSFSLREFPEKLASSCPIVRQRFSRAVFHGLGGLSQARLSGKVGLQRDES
jgi:hypothetical protein